VNPSDPPRLLILSFSPIASDARVLKQVEHFASRYDVTTCGFGEAPDAPVTHVAVEPQSGPPWRRRDLILRRFRSIYRGDPVTGAARRALADLPPFDVIVANDIETVGLALDLSPRHGVHADIHEYAPLLNEEVLIWRLAVAPYKRWLCRTFLTRASSVTTVGKGIADEYARVYGVRAEVVTNAAPWAPLKASGVGETVRIVHSGAALRNRGLEHTIQAVLGTEAPVTLDLYLVPNDPAYLRELRELAAQDDRIVFHEPVRYQELVATLNGYDVGVHVIPPTNFNNRWALPNKLFDYVQARLGVLVGPSAEMAAVVREHSLGVVAGGFEAQDIGRALLELSPDSVRRWKANAEASAHALSAEEQVAILDRAVARLLATAAA
jgi:hypothetical protein